MDPVSLGIAGAGLGASVLGSLFGGDDGGRGAVMREIYGPGGPYDADRQRQKGYDAEAQKTLQRLIGRYDNVPGQMDSRAQTVADFYKANDGQLPNSGPTTGTIPTPTSRAVVADNAAKSAKV